MNKIKKTILTLVLLMTAATGAWAEGYYNINIDFGSVYNPEFTIFMCHVMGPDMPSGTLNLSVDGVSKGSFDVENGMCSREISPALDAGDHTWYAEFIPEGGGEKSTEQRSFTIDQDFAYVYIDDPEQSSIEMGVGESRNFRGHVDGPESSEVNISSSNDNVAKFRASYSSSYGFEGYIDAVGAGTATITVSFAGNKNYKAAQSKTLTVTVLAPAASGPEVDGPTIVEGKPQWTFTMPGGNVTLEPEYYPQAALTAAPTAIDNVPATTDGAIVEAGTVANIGETTNAQGTVMYYVSPTALDDAALLALAADQWTADVPTAAHLAEGTAYVYYYVRGNDSNTDDENFSDGDILAANALTVTIAAEPTYAVTFADGVNPEPPAEPEWTASPAAGVKKGQTVTVTYTGSKKVIGVKAEKKAATTSSQLSAVTTDDIGKVVCAEGHLHDAKTAVPDGCTAVGILGKVTGDGHGLILALQDAAQQNWNTINGWTSVDTYAGTTLKVLPAGALGSLTSYTTLGSTTVSNWAVAQKSDYDAIFTNLVSATGDSDGYTYDGNVNAYITTGVGGTAISGNYWSATGFPDEDNYAWLFGSISWINDVKTNSHSVRPVLAF